ncbi:MAG: hypothetical protein ACO4CT_18225 [Planctomycetota bacterium]
MKPSRKLAAAFLLAVLPLGACATTVGTVVGPVGANISFFRHTEGTPDWLRPLAVPMIAVAGPRVGFVNGLLADLGYLAHGSYGVDGRRPFASVLDPANPDWGRPDWNRFTGSASTPQ